jgi:hypothetical protein
MDPCEYARIYDRGIQTNLTLRAALEPALWQIEDPSSRSRRATVSAPELQHRQPSRTGPSGPRGLG